MEMKVRSMTIGGLVAMAVSLTACNPVQAMLSSQAVTGVIARPAPQPSRPSASDAASTAPAHSQEVSPAARPAAEPNIGAPAPKVVGSERRQTLTVAQPFSLLTHVQSIAGTGEETVEWWELRDPNGRVVYRQAYAVALENGSFEDITEVSASSFTTKLGSGILVQGMDLPSAPGSGSWVQVFGFKYGRDKYGADESLFGPFGPPIAIEGEFLEIGTDRGAGTDPQAAKKDLLSSEQSS
jgi:hypothetical protein